MYHPRFYQQLHRYLKTAFPQALWEGPAQPRIALTFDDGPHPLFTPALLKILGKYQVQASFFWLGEAVKKYPHIAQQVYAQQHWIGMHGYQHLPFLTAWNLRESLRATQEIIYAACSLEPDRVKDVRPPFGIFTPQTLQLLRVWHYRPVLWQVYVDDSSRPGIATVTERVISQTLPGALIVLHDGWAGGQDVAAVVEQIIPKLLVQGYQFVSIDEFWQAKNIMNNTEI